MVSPFSVSISDVARVGRWARLVAAVVLAALCLLSAHGAGAAAGLGRPAVVPLAHQHDRSDDASPHYTRLDPVTKPGDRPAGGARPGGQEDTFTTRALGRGRAFLDRYGSDALVRAVLAGALVQLLCLVLFRLIGTVLRLAARGFAMAIGVAIALAVLGGPASLPMSGDEAAKWFGRLAALVA
jgi:hypothetical protein